MFVRTAAFYDKIYAATGKEYVREARAFAELIRTEFPTAASLLDVGCGTGAHLAEFARLGFTCRGVDADLKMVALARARCPELEIDPADMQTLDLHERFDAVVALFGTTAYSRTHGNLRTAVGRFAAHLAPGGVLVVEAFLDRDEYVPGYVSAVYVDEPDLKIARMSVAKQMGAIAIVDFHYLVAGTTGVERYFERHELGLFSNDDYRAAFEAAGLDFAVRTVSHVRANRRIFVGRAPRDA